MRMPAACLSLALSGLMPSLALSQTAQPVPTGIWLDQEARGAIEITRCDRSLCGRIVWLQQPNDPTGKPLADILNPDSSKRDGAICGLQIIGDLKRETTGGGWVEGWIYDPEVGRRFNLEIMLKSADELSVFAFDKDRARSETLVWKRLPDTAPRCG